MYADWTTSAIQPFGVIVTAGEAETDLSSIPTQLIEDWVDERRVVVLRGFAAPEGESLKAFGETLGEVLEWEFGAVNDLHVKPDAKNYLYTPGAVPFHWDGAFIGRIPHYIVFHCAEVPGPECGGETLFTDTTLLLASTPEEDKKLWRTLTITYSTEKVVHYGGQFSSPMIAVHPTTSEPILRYAEPVADLNPVHLDIPGLTSGEQERLIGDLHGRLNDSSACYAHPWQDGDIVIADNHALLHGRRAFKTQAGRRLRRVNVL